MWRRHLSPARGSRVHLPEWSGGPLGLPAVLALVYLLLPLAALVAVSVPTLGRGLTGPGVADAVRLTVLTSTLATALSAAAGTPLAYLLARRTFPGHRLLETAVELPLVVPPVVAGVALLVAFGRRGLLGPALGVLGLEVPFTTAAVVLAQLFVAGPFYVASSRAGFAAIPREVEEAAAIDGASSWQQFRAIAVPLALPSLVSGAILCWARATSEFGATLLFAGNLPGRTQTMSLAIMSALEVDLGTALALSVLLLALSCTVLGAVRLVAGRAPVAW